MKNSLRFLILVLILFPAVFSCRTRSASLTSTDDGKIDLNFILINDVYEIAPIAGGHEGGMARVATLKKKYLAQNPNTFLVMAGDFVSPSVFNSLKYDGKLIRGRQMIESMNAAGVDFAVFGNHEFDIRESELQDRLNESKFRWISSNAFGKKENRIVPFKANDQPLATAYTLAVTDADGTPARIGIIGLCGPYNRAEYVHYDDAISTARRIYDSIKGTVDAVIAITHEYVSEDVKLAKEIPGLAVILGGHEHDQRFRKVGDVYITKALSDAKSAFVVQVRINKKKNTHKVYPEVKTIGDDLPFDSATNAVVTKWTNIADRSFAGLGFDPKRIVLQKGEPLDARETYIRRGPTNLSKAIARSMQAAVPLCDVVLFNAGSIRVDDMLPMPLTEYDVIRSLPFGGGIREVEMRGRLLLQVLNNARKNAGFGGFLIYNDELISTASGWTLAGKPIDPQTIYRVAVTDYLFTGKESNLDMLNAANPDITKIYPMPKEGSPGADIRHMLINYLTMAQ